MKSVRLYLYFGVLLLAVALSFAAAERQLWLETQAGHHTPCYKQALPLIAPGTPSSCDSTCTFWCSDKKRHGSNGSCGNVGYSTDKQGNKSSSSTRKTKRRICNCGSGVCRDLGVRTEGGFLKKCYLITCKTSSAD